MFFIKTEVIKLAGNDEKSPLIQNKHSSINNEGEEIEKEIKTKSDPKIDRLIKRMHPDIKKMVGLISASIQGFFYGIMYSPILYLIKNYENANKNMMNYSFPLSVGIFASSLLFLIIYSILMKGEPNIYPESLFPCMCLTGISKIFSFPI